MPHLIAQQMGGGIHFRHERAIGVPQVVIFEVNMKPGLDFPRGVFHGVHRLDFPVRQTVDKFRGKNLLAAQVLNEPLILGAQRGELNFIL